MKADAQNEGAVKVNSLKPFVAVKVEGPMKVIMTQVDDEEQTGFSRDSTNNSGMRISVSVDKHGVLTIRERGAKLAADSTEFRICYRTLESLVADEASVRFESPIRQLSFDASISGGAVVDLPLETTDAVVEMTGKSRLKLSGTCRYFDLTVSTGRVDASALTATSARVKATHKAQVKLHAMERLDASAAQAEVICLEEPSILRAKTSVGGRVNSVEELEKQAEKPENKE